ncbi:Vancomycin resistance protein YoaR, contains peptidoglycan-binding and VanW domains [Lachnospiraceae bacterium NE2001]|nr:Vancomycin resistance protein YoaR, contains peptidoglycan-binding and VanW domains [Lachnospiraceae bacterium NE2001]
MKRFRSVMSVILAMTLAMAAPGLKSFAATETDATQSDALIATNDADAPTILDNIFINDINVGGMTEAEAKAKFGVDDSVKSATVTLSSDYGEVETTLGELGLTNNADEVVEQAINYGNHGNVLQRYKDLESLKTEPVKFESKSQISADALDYLVEGKLGNEMEGLNQYSLDKSGEQIKVIVEGQSVSVDAPATAAAIEEIINKDGYAGGAVNTNVVLADNSENEKLAQIARIKDRLGTYTTSYASSGSARKNNVQRAASLVDGHVLFPGEQISVYNCIAPIEVSNGYELAHAYVGTEVVDAAGGGVCQVATTLYNAAIRAELEIVQRNCHSLRVSYVPISADAAIAGGVLDLKLRNNLDAPIYIEACYDGANLSFNIYGEEYRPSNRTIEFESIQTGVINPPDEPIYTEDKSLPAGTEQVTASAVTGYTGELWKYVYVDGVKTESIKMNSSKYQASAAKISINSDPAEEGEESEDEDDNQQSENPDGTSETTTNPDGTPVNPTETTTAAPVETPTEAPTAAPAETPTEAPTAAPAETPTEAPTTPQVTEGAADTSGQ